WPGNLRELQSVLKQALLRASGGVLVPEFVPPLTSDRNGEVPKSGKDSAPDPESFIRDRLQAGSQDLYAESLAAMERHLIMAVLRHTKGNQLQAAKILGITRGSLRTKVRTLGIAIERQV